MARLPFIARAAIAGAALPVAGLALAGCGSGSQPHTIVVPRRIASLTTTVSRLAVTRTAPGRPVGPAIGTAQRVSTRGAGLTVTVTHVLDPLTGSGAALLPATRAVGVEVQIANSGPEIYDSSATGDISITVSAGTTSPVFASRGVCQTPLQDFDSYITPGEVRSGCVVFAVASRARVTSVRFSPHAAALGRLTWRGA